MPRSPGGEADPRVAALGVLLRRYWRRNPLACDSPEGIAQWWLPEGHGATLAQVRAALETLEENGLVEKVVRADARMHYRLREEVAGELRRLDVDGPAPPGGLH
jgi:DNA-binding transcriptional ArsR family regulator